MCVMAMMLKQSVRSACRQRKRGEHTAIADNATIQMKCSVIGISSCTYRLMQIGIVATQVGFVSRHQCLLSCHDSFSTVLCSDAGCYRVRPMTMLW